MNLCVAGMNSQMIGYSMGIIIGFVVMTALFIRSRFGDDE